MLEATTLSCCTSGLSSFPAFSLLLLLLLRPAGGAVWKRPRLGGSGLPRRRYRASISCFCWLCSSEISFRCLQEGREGGGRPEAVHQRPGQAGRAGGRGAQPQRPRTRTAQRQQVHSRLPVFICTRRAPWGSPAHTPTTLRARGRASGDSSPHDAAALSGWGVHIYAHNTHPTNPSEEKNNQNGEAASALPASAIPPSEGATGEPLHMRPREQGAARVPPGGHPAEAIPPPGYMAMKTQAQLLTVGEGSF